MDHTNTYRAAIDAALWDDPLNLRDERDLCAVVVSLYSIIKKREAVRKQSRTRRRVRELINAGFSQPEIVRKLGISRQAVNLHVCLGRMLR